MSGKKSSRSVRFVSNEDEQEQIAQLKSRLCTRTRATLVHGTNVIHISKQCEGGLYFKL